MPDLRISVIVPVLNEAQGLALTLQACRDPLVSEIIVVDGGSQDGTPRIAVQLGARVIESERGRASQMNAGAFAATGNVLLFLHGDTLLPRGFGQDVHAVLSQAGTAAGAFRLRIGAAGFSYRIIERMVNWRSRIFGLPYGDQALFLACETFSASRGFPPLPIMEDLVYVRSLRKLGRIAISRKRVITSARRWERTGVWKMTLINQLALLSYLAGSDPERIARWYRKRTKIE
jgi:rSAM/selenodomain-associated transferase 2